MFAVTIGGSFVGSTVLTNISTGASSDGFPSFSYLFFQVNKNRRKNKNVCDQPIMLLTEVRVCRDKFLFR